MLDPLLTFSDALVSRVADSAEQAGVLPGDVPLAVDGATAPHMRAMARPLGGRAAGMGVVLRLLRGGTPVELPVLVAARPAA